MGTIGRPPCPPIHATQPLSRPPSLSGSATGLPAWVESVAPVVVRTPVEHVAPLSLSFGRRVSKGVVRHLHYS